MSPSLHMRSDLTGRIVGILVFLLGIGMLFVVFRLAYALYHASPADALGLRFTNNAKTDPGLNLIVARVGVLLVRVLSLFVMAIASSLICQFGVKLYFSAIKGSTPEVLTQHVTNPAQGP